MSLKLAIIHLVFFVIFFAFTNSGIAQQLPEDFSDQLVINDLNRPTGLTFDERGRGYIWEKRGRVHLLDTNGVKLTPPLIDIQEEISNYNDHGLLGFALDPDFFENGYFYLMYIVDRHHLLHFGTPEYDPSITLNKQATIGRITRYTADATKDFKEALPDSRKILLGETKETGFPVLMISHGVGTLTFGQDGTLLASCGDAGSFIKSDLGNAEETYFEQALADGILKPKENVGSLRALLLDNLNGKIIRIDPATGNGVSSNPYFDPAAPRAARSRVWSSGFRNPFRFVVRPESGDHFPEVGNPGALFIGDVGAGSWEELNVADQPGQFFGWPIYEGFDSKWQFDHAKVENLDAPNPLFGNNCDQEYFYFFNLVQEETPTGTAVFSNPCDPLIPISSDVPTLEHTRPAMAWSNVLWNLPTKTRVGIFTDEGVAAWTSADSDNSPIESRIFDGFSSIPGLFYDDGNYPEIYHDKLFCADFSGWIHTFEFDENNNLITVEDFFKRDTGVVDLALNPKDGCIYYLHFYDNALHKICYGGNPPPVAKANADAYFGVSPLTVQFDGSESFDPFGEPLTHFWNFGNDQFSMDVSPSQVFSTPDNEPTLFQVQLTVADTLGAEGTAELFISLNNTPPNVRISSFENGDQYPVSDLTFLPLEAIVSDAEHTAEELTYEWTVFLRHNTHAHPEAIDNKPNSIAVIDPAGCGTESFWYQVRLQVTDAHGLSSIDEKEIFPYCGAAFFNIDLLSATANDKNVKLNWSTTFENNLSHFEIQRLTSDFQFVKIGEIAAAGMTSQSTAYTFTDAAPLLGNNRYRIKAFNQTSLYDYSNQAQVFFPTQQDYVVYPNPAQSDFTIELKEVKTGILELEIFDENGRQVLEKKWQEHIGTAWSQTVSIAELPNGVYFYKIHNGEEVGEGKLLVLEE